MKINKFRAWDKKENKMYYDVQDTYDYMCNGKGCLEENFGDVLEDDRYIVMQYINLEDDNGTEIYEGDILYVTGYSYYEPEFEYFGEIKYTNYGYCIEYEDDIINIFDCLEGNYRTVLKIKGNIFENKELLNE